MDGKLAVGLIHFEARPFGLTIGIGHDRQCFGAFGEFAGRAD